MKIYCCGCGVEVAARLTDGIEIYPHRNDLKDVPFWICDQCKNYVGCHHKTKDRTKPLGVIPTKEIMRARKHIHSILDPLWEGGKMGRKKVYAILSERLGYEYHTGNIRSIEEARAVYRIVKTLTKRA